MYLLIVLVQNSVNVKMQVTLVHTALFELFF